MRKILGAPALAIALLILLAGGQSSPAALAAGICVNVGGTDGCYASIQAAVNAAPPGATIEVEHGTFTEQVTITKNLVLDGDGENSTRLKTPATLNPDRHGNFIVLEIGGGADVTVKNLDVTGLGPAITTCNDAMFGVYVLGGANLHMRDARVTDTRNASSPGCPSRGAVQVGSGAFSETGHGEFDDVTVSGYEGSGIKGVGPSSTLTVRNSNVHRAPSSVIATVGIWAQADVTAHIVNNNVSGNECNASGCGPDPAMNFQSAGIDISGLHTTSVEVRDNEVFDNDIGIAGAGNRTTVEITGNDLHNNRYEGIDLLDGGTYHVNDNLVRGGNIGVSMVLNSAVYGPALASVVASLGENTITHTQVGILLSDTLTSDAFIPVLTGRQNSIEGNSVAGLQNTTSQVPDVRENFWGSASGPTNPANPGGHGDTITGPAQFKPFLTEEPR